MEETEEILLQGAGIREDEEREVVRRIQRGEEKIEGAARCPLFPDKEIILRVTAQRKGVHGYRAPFSV